MILGWFKALLCSFCCKSEPKQPKFDLNALEAEIDKMLDAETSETLTEWLENHRNN